MIEIYGSFRSRSRRVLWAALELGIEFDHIPLSWSDPNLGESEFLEINPLGRIPALKDDQIYLSESLAINLYLARTYSQPDNGLYPFDRSLEPLIWQWSHFSASDLDPWVVNFGDHSAWLPGERRDPVIAEFSRKSLNKSVALLEKGLSYSGYLIAGRITVADLNVASVLQSIVPLDFSLDEYPAVKKWLLGSLARPAAVAARGYA